MIKFTCSVVFILLKGIFDVIFFEKISRMRCDDGRNNIDKLEFMLAIKEKTAEGLVLGLESVCRKLLFP